MVAIHDCNSLSSIHKCNKSLKQIAVFILFIGLLPCYTDAAAARIKKFWVDYVHNPFFNRSNNDAAKLDLQKNSVHAELSQSDLYKQMQELLGYEKIIRKRTYLAGKGAALSKAHLSQTTASGQKLDRKRSVSSKLSSNALENGAKTTNDPHALDELANDSAISSQATGTALNRSFPKEGTSKNFKEAATLSSAIINQAFKYLNQAELGSIKQGESNAEAVENDVWLYTIDEDYLIIVHRHILAVDMTVVQFCNEIHKRADYIWNNGLKEKLKKHNKRQHIHLGYGSGASLATLAARRSVVSPGLLAYNEDCSNSSNQVIVLTWNGMPIFTSEMVDQYPVRNRNHLQFITKNQTTHLTNPTLSTKFRQQLKFGYNGRALHLCIKPTKKQGFSMQPEKLKLDINNRLCGNKYDELDEKQLSALTKDFHANQNEINNFSTLVGAGFEKNVVNVRLGSLQKGAKKFACQLSEALFQNEEMVNCSITQLEEKDQNALLPIMYRMFCVHKAYPNIPFAKYDVILALENEQETHKHMLLSREYPTENVASPKRTECIKSLFERHAAWELITPIEFSQKICTFVPFNISKFFSKQAKGILIRSVMTLKEFSSIYKKEPQLFISMIDVKHTIFPDNCKSEIEPINLDTDVRASRETQALLRFTQDYLTQLPNALSSNGQGGTDAAGIARINGFKTTNFAISDSARPTEEYIEYFDAQNPLLDVKIYDCTQKWNLWIPQVCPELCIQDPSCFLCSKVVHVPNLSLHIGISPTSELYYTFQNQFSKLKAKLSTPQSAHSKYAIFQIESNKKYGKLLYLYSRFYVGLFWGDD